MIILCEMCSINKIHHLFSLNYVSFSRGSKFVVNWKSAFGVEFSSIKPLKLTSQINFPSVRKSVAQINPCAFFTKFFIISRL